MPATAGGGGGGGGSSTQERMQLIRVAVVDFETPRNALYVRIGILTYAHVRSRMLSYARVCSGTMLRGVVTHLSRALTEP